MIPTKRRDIFRVAIVTLAALFLIVAGITYYGAWYDEWSGYNAGLSISDGYCNIAVIPIQGSIVEYPNILEDGSGYPVPPSTNPDDVIARIESAELDPYVTGIMLTIDSYGGMPAASEAIANRLKTSTLPVVALIRSYGTSAAYHIATGADTIIASPFSDVGSIGVTMSYLSYAKQNEQEGITYEQLASAPFKNYGDPDKALTDEERALFQRDLDILHDEFVKQVAENRGMSVEEVEVLADGSSVPGRLALEKKLVDALGDAATAKKWLAENLGIAEEDVAFCR